MGDKLACAGCGTEIIIGFGHRPLAEHYQRRARARANATYILTAGLTIRLKPTPAEWARYVRTMVARRLKAESRRCSRRALEREIATAEPPKGSSVDLDMRKHIAARLWVSVYGTLEYEFHSIPH